MLADVTRDRDSFDLPRRPPKPAPLVLPAIGFMAGIGLADAVGLTASLHTAMLGLACLCAIASLNCALRGAHGAAIVLVIAAGGAAGYLRYQTTLPQRDDHVTRLRTATPALIRVRAVVDTSPVDSSVLRTGNAPGRATFMARLTHRIDEGQLHPLHGSVAVSVRLPKMFHAIDLEFGPGDPIEMEALLMPARLVRNPGEVDWERVQWLKGVEARLTCDDPLHITILPRPPWSIARARESVRACARRLLLEVDSLHDAPDASRLLDAMILGQRSSTARHIDEAFAKAGAIHFLSVSGFHVAVLVFMAWLFADWVTRGSRVAAGLLTLAFMASYMFLAELNAPMARTAIAVVLLVIGSWLWRPMASLNWLAAAALLILLLDPRELLRPGFQLSFVQVAYLLALLPSVQRWTHKRLRHDTSSVLWLAAQRTMIAATVGLAISAGAWLISLPIVLWHFERCTPWGAIGALVATPFVTGLLWISFLTLVANAFVGWLAAPWLSLLAQRWGEATLYVVELLAALPGSDIPMSAPPLPLVLGSYICLGMAIAFHHRQQQSPGELAAGASQRAWRRSAAIAVSLALAWGAHASSQLFEPRALKLHVLDVGHGSLSLLSSGEHACLLDAGGPSAYGPELLQRAKRHLNASDIQTVVLTRPSSDAVSILDVVCDPASSTQMFVSPAFSDALRSQSLRRVHERWIAKRPQATNSELTQRRAVHAGDVVRWGDQQFQVLWPPRDYFELSRMQRGLILRQETGGGAILICGTTSRRALTHLSNLHEAGELSLSSAVLLMTAPGAPEELGRWHAFLLQVRPRWIVVAGMDRSQPVEAEALLRASAAGCGAAFLSTQSNGAVTLACDGTGAWRVRWMLGPDEALRSDGEKKSADGSLPSGSRL